MTIEDNLEHMIDQTSVQDVLNYMADICHEKADHLRNNWQDPATAKVWSRAGRMLYSLAAKMEV